MNVIVCGELCKEGAAAAISHLVGVVLYISELVILFLLLRTFFSFFLLCFVCSIQPLGCSIFTWSLRQHACLKSGCSLKQGARPRKQTPNMDGSAST